MTKDDEKYIHPLLVKIIRKCQGTPSSSTTPGASQKNDYHEMSWRANGNVNATGMAWTTNGHSRSSNGKPIRVGYDNASFQET